MSAIDLENIWIMDTTEGRIIIELNPEIAPLHSERIRVLTRDDFYDGIFFHRVIDDFVAQAGDPSATGFGGSDLPDLPLEPSDVAHVRGAVSMARAGNDPDSGNSQFFIVIGDDATFLDGDFSLFGQVLQGIEVADALPRGEPQVAQDQETGEVILQGIFAPDGRQIQPGQILDAEIGADATPVTGTDGADTRALADSDVIVDLGLGADVVTVAADRAAYTVEIDEATGETSLHGTLNGANTFTELRGVETIAFNDEAITIDTGEAPEPEPEPQPDPDAPNAFLTLDGDIAAGFFAPGGLLSTVVGNTGGSTVSIASGSAASGLSAGTAVNIAGNSSAFTFQRDGTTIEIRDNSGALVASLNAAGGETSAIRFDDAGLAMTVAEGTILLAGEPIADQQEVPASSLTLDNGASHGGAFDSDAAAVSRPSEANAFLTLTDDTPDDFIVNAGLDVDIVGQTTGKIITIAEGGGAQGIDPGTSVTVSQSLVGLTVERDGTAVVLRSEEDGTVLATLNVGTGSTSTLSTPDGETSISVANGTIMVGDNTLDDGQSIVGNTLVPASGGQVDLDTLSGTLRSPAEFDAGEEAFVFTDDASAESSTDINNFGADDALLFEGVTAADVDVAVSGGDTEFEFVDPSIGAGSVVTLIGVSGFFTSVSEFNAAADFGDVSFG